MAGSVNKVILVGNLGADPELRKMQNGNSVCNLRVVTNESWKDRDSGEKRERAEFHRVVIFNENLCKIAEQYLRKGSSVYLEGQLQTRSYEQEGVTKYSTEIVLQNFDGRLTMLNSPKSAQGSEGGTQGGNGQGSSGAQGGGGFDDDIPF
jgi:single-strand DNA-binding protein